MEIYHFNAVMPKSAQENMTKLKRIVGTSRIEAALAISLDFLLASGAQRVGLEKYARRRTRKILDVEDLARNHHALKREGG